MDAAGEPPLLTWQDCGPSRATELEQQYEHDGAISTTWESVKAPTGLVHDWLLTKLLDPAAAVPRKRVTILYAPMDADRAPDAADRDLKTAINRINSKQGMATAAETAALAAARQATEEESRGAGLVEFSVLVTATVEDYSQLPKAGKAVESAARYARFRVDRMDKTQAAGWQICLGIGLVPSTLSVLPASAREHI